jgi:hypothetical protein
MTTAFILNLIGFCWLLPYPFIINASAYLTLSLSSLLSLSLLSLSCMSLYKLVCSNGSLSLQLSLSFYTSALYNCLHLFLCVSAYFSLVLFFLLVSSSFICVFIYVFSLSLSLSRSLRLCHLFVFLSFALSISVSTSTSHCISSSLYLNPSVSLFLIFYVDVSLFPLCLFFSLFHSLDKLSL